MSTRFVLVVVMRRVMTASWNRRVTRQQCVALGANASMLGRPVLVPALEDDFPGLGSYAEFIDYPIEEVVSFGQVLWLGDRVDVSMQVVDVLELVFLEESFVLALECFEVDVSCCFPPSLGEED